MRVNVEISGQSIATPGKGGIRSHTLTAHVMEGQKSRSRLPGGDLMRDLLLQAE
jgi:hypothetical protein